MEDSVNNTTRSIRLLQQKRATDSLLSVLGVCVGGGLFLVVVFVGVICWVSKERREDEEMRKEAEKFVRGRARGVVIDVRETTLT